MPVVCMTWQPSASMTERSAAPTPKPAPRTSLTGLKRDSELMDTLRATVDLVSS